MTKDRNHTTLFHEDSDVGDDAGGTIGTVANQRGIGSVYSYMNDGWIRLHRSLRHHWLMTKPDYLAIWIWILLNTNHTKSTAIIAGKPVTIERGEVIVSVRSLAKQTGTTEQKVRSALKLFIIDSMLEAKSNTGATHLKVLNYNRLQTADREQVTHGQHTDNTIKELRIKKNKEVTITDTIDRGATLSRSRPRSQDEATAYFVQIGSTPKEGATFWDHFESNGWKVGGKTAMKNWHSAARNWVRRNEKNQRNTNGKRSKGERSVEAGTPDSLFRLARLERPDRRGGIGALELDSSNGRALGIGPPNDNRTEPAQLLLGRIDSDEL